MAEYIKRVDAMEICRRYSKHCFKTCDAKGQDIAERIEDNIIAIPTADVEEVKHGEWHLLDECSNEGVYCSVCHKKVYRIEYANQKVKSKYCPNCGAKMDGGKAE